jgi:hypothetical protein
VHILDGRLEHSGFLRIQLDLISVNNNRGSKKVNFTAVDSRVDFISKLGAVRSAVTRLIRHSEVWCPVVVIKTGLSNFAHCLYVCLCADSLPSCNGDVDRFTGRSLGSRACSCKNKFTRSVDYGP